MHFAISFWPASSPSASPTRAAALDTGTPGHAQTAPERTKRQPQKRTWTERDTETAPTAEPPQRSSPEAERQKSQSQHDSSDGDKTASRHPAHQSRRDRDRARVPEARHCRPRTETETERRRAEKERERRENDSKTPLFSPSHRTPSRSTTRASPAPADTNSRRNAAFFGSAFVEYAELTEINASSDHTKDGGRFTFSRLQQRQKFGFVPSSPRLYLFHQTPILKHTVHQRYILLQA